MRKVTPLAVAGLVVLAASLGAVAPQKWELRTADDFLRGKFDGVSVTSDGTLALAPREEKIAGPGRGFLPVRPSHGPTGRPTSAPATTAGSTRSARTGRPSSLSRPPRWT